MQDREILPGSAGAIPDDARSARAVRKDEEIAVSLYLRACDKPDGGGAARMGREELATQRATELRPALDAIQEYAQEVGLKVAGEDPARLLMQLIGTAAVMEHAFGIALYDCEVDGKSCRYYRGSIRLPSHIVPFVTAVLGLDERLAAQAR